MSTTVGAATGAARNVVRTLSFGRARKQPAPRGTLATPRNAHDHGLHASAPREVCLFKADDAPIGMTLVKPALDGLSPEGEGVMVAALVPGGIAAKTKRIKSGDLLCAVNGVKVLDYKHAADLLRTAKGLVQCVIMSPSSLPDGWEAHTDRKGNVYFLHRESKLRSCYHPAAVSIKKRRSSNDQPVSAATRWRTAFHTVALINALAGETELDDVRRSDEDEVAGTKGYVLQRERV